MLHLFTPYLFHLVCFNYYIYLIIFIIIFNLIVYTINNFILYLFHFNLAYRTDKVRCVFWNEKIYSIFIFSNCSLTNTSTNAPVQKAGVWIRWSQVVVGVLPSLGRETGNPALVASGTVFFSRSVRSPHIGMPF